MQSEAFELIDRFEKAVDANGYRTRDRHTEEEYRAALAALEAALSAAEPQPAPSVAVKALEWRNGIRGIVQADTLGGIYQIRDYNGTVWLDMPEATHMRDPYGSVDHAKAAAQADYEARIRSALSAQVQDVAEDVYISADDVSATSGSWIQQGSYSGAVEVNWFGAMQDVAQGIDDRMTELAKDAFDKGFTRSSFAQTAEWAFDEVTDAAPAKQEG